MARRKKVELEQPAGSVSFSPEEVCRLELEAAIEVLATSYNIVATHVLASSAHDVMRGHAARHRKPLRADMRETLKGLRREDSRTVVDALSHAFNSMKHSNPGPIQVHPVFIELTLYNACLEFGSLFGFVTPNMTFYLLWALVAHQPLGMVAPDQAKQLFPSAMKRDARLDQLTELRAHLADIRAFPDHYGNMREDLSTAHLWND